MNLEKLILSNNYQFSHNVLECYGENYFRTFGISYLKREGKCYGVLGSHSTDEFNWFTLLFANDIKFTLRFIGYWDEKIFRPTILCHTRDLIGNWKLIDWEYRVCNLNDPILDYNKSIQDTMIELILRHELEIMSAYTTFKKYILSQGFESHFDTLDKTQEQQDFEKNCSKYYLTPQDYGKSLHIDGEEYKITGINNKIQTGKHVIISHKTNGSKKIIHCDDALTALR